MLQPMNRLTKHQKGAVRRQSSTKTLFLVASAFISWLAVLTRLGKQVVDDKSIDRLNFNKNLSSFNIFYNVYLNPKDVTNGLRIVKEQLDQIVTSSSFHTKVVNTGDLLSINIVSVGKLSKEMFLDSFLETTCHERNLTCHHVSHHNQGFEEVTLSRLYDYCLDHQEECIGYIHNKGSYHGTEGNEMMRWSLTTAVSMEECWNPPNKTCNVCSLHFWPLWSTFFPGNMWVASCSYVAKLIPLSLIELRMATLFTEMRRLVNETKLTNTLYRNVEMFGEDHSYYVDWFGLDRFALEHWIGSNPSLEPCDVAGKWAGDLWNDERANESDLTWSMAPHAPMGPPYNYWNFNKWHRDDDQDIAILIMQDNKTCLHEYFLLPGYLHKWVYLYNETPPLSSWVWSWFPDGPLWQQQVADFGVDVVSKISRLDNTVSL